MAEEKDKDAQEVDINDADVSAQSERPRGTRPPPLPPEASLPPQPVHSPSQAAPPSPSYLPPRPSTMPPPAKRSAGLYVILIGAFLVVGLGGGVGVALYLKKTNPPTAPSATSTTAAAASQKPAVITIPTVEMDDSDAGP